MSKTADFLAIDLGAESGRGVIGSFDGGRLKLKVVHRFPNGPVRAGGSLYWDALRLFDEIQHSLALTAKRGPISGVGVDTWGVDYGLLGRGDVLLGNPYHYRDSRTDGMMEEAFKKVPPEEIFERTGIQFMQINTLYQLLSMSKDRSPLLQMAETLLLMPNLFSFWLSGAKVAEFTDATTTQCYDPRAGGWALEMMERLGLPTGILPEIVPPATVLGPILPEVAEQTGARDVPVIATASHDTAAAVAAVPAVGSSCAYISSGTWSLMGVESREPIINDDVRRANFTNEGGVGGTFRFLKNIMGLWLIQESRRTWARQGRNLSYEEISQLAADAQPFKAIIDVDHPSFLAPGDMPARIREFCRTTGQDVPETEGEIARTALEGLALKYRYTLDRLEELTNRRLDVIHVVGGGCQNKLLCQFAADATGRPVIAGPVEATAAGNVLVQALAVGLIASLGEARAIVRSSFDLDRYEPRDTTGWQEAGDRLRRILDGRL